MSWWPGQCGGSACSLCAHCGDLHSGLSAVLILISVLTPPVPRPQQTCLCGTENTSWLTSQGWKSGLGTCFNSLESKSFLSSNHCLHFTTKVNNLFLVSVTKIVGFWKLGSRSQICLFENLFNSFLFKDGFPGIHCLFTDVCWEVLFFTKQGFHVRTDVRARGPCGAGKEVPS